MSRTTFLVAVAGGIIWFQAALGQSLLNRAETLQAPAGTAPSSGSAAPGGGYLGYTPVEGTDDGRGVQVESVKPGAPAAAGGLKDGDLITAVNGKRMTLEQFDQFLLTASPGQKVQLTVDRGGRTQQLTVQLGSRATPAAPAGTPPGESTFSSPSLTPPSGSSPSAPGGSFSAPSTSPAVGSTPSLTTPSLTAPTAPGGIDATSPSLTPPTTSDPLADRGAPSTPSAGETSPRSIQAQPLDLGPPPSAAERDIRGGRPPVSHGEGSGASLGITVVPLTEDARAQAGVPVQRGAMIANVKRGSPAEQAGLPIGGVIVRMDSREVTSADDLVAGVKAAQPGQEVEVTYYDRSRLYRKLVRLAGTGGSEADPGSSIAAPPAGGGGEGLPRGAPGALGNRPMLRNLGQMAADAMSRPGGLSTVYDPSVVAALQARVTELTEQTQQLEERIRMLESKLGGAGGTSPGPSVTPSFVPPASAPQSAPSFGTPSGPGFGPALGTGTAP